MVCVCVVVEVCVMCEGRCMVMRKGYVLCCMAGVCVCGLVM